MKMNAKSIDAHGGGRAGLAISIVFARTMSALNEPKVLTFF